MFDRGLNREVDVGLMQDAGRELKPGGAEVYLLESKSR